MISASAGILEEEGVVEGDEIAGVGVGFQSFNVVPPSLSTRVELEVDEVDSERSVVGSGLHSSSSAIKTPSSPTSRIKVCILLIGCHAPGFLRTRRTSV